MPMPMSLRPVPQSCANTSQSTSRTEVLIVRGTACMLSALMISCVAGCGGGGSPDTASVPAPAGEVVSTEPPASAAPQTKANQEPEQPSAETNNQQETAQTEFAPLAIGALAGRGDDEGNASSSSDGDREKNIKSVIEKLRPLQVMLGTWRGTTRKEFDGFKAVDEHEWVWDLTTQPDQPALIMKSDKSPYLRSARLTWLPAAELFRMEATDPEGKTRTFEGNYTEEVHEVVGSDDKLHKVFRLELNETVAEGDGGAGREYLQLAFAQQESNRYLLEVSQRRGKAAWRRVDTVSTQREGTSFALSDTDYAERTCIISQGLGTMSITYKGRDYWVCCTGCRAAFEEDPERWIARSAEMQKKQ